MRNIWKYAALLVALIAAVSVAGTAGAVVRPAIHRGGSLTVLLPGTEWPTLDPAVNTQDTADQQLNNAIFGQLFEQGPNDTVVPSIATGYKFLNHNLEVDIYLHHGVKFQDGSVLTAQNAAWSMQRDLANACLCAANFKVVKAITTKGPYTLVLQLSNPDSAIIASFIGYAPDWVVPQKTFNSEPESAYSQHPVGAGPFKVVANAASSRLQLTRFSGFFEKGQPYLNNLTFVSVASGESQLAAITAGQAQYATLDSITLVPTIRSNPNLRLIASPADIVQFVQLNERTGPFSNLLAREALQYATNAKALVRSLYDNVYIPVQSFTAPGMLFYHKTIPGFRAYNPAKARQLVAQLGGLSFTLDTTTNTPFWVTETEALASMWSAVGIHAHVVVDTLQNFLQKLAQNNWQGITANWGSLDPGTSLPTQFASGGLLSGTHDPTLDGLMNQGVQFANPATRDRVYLKLQKYMAAQQVAVFEYAKPVISVSTRAVNGIQNYGNIVQWERVWLS